MGDCPFTQKAMLCLALHGLSYERKLVDLANKPQHFLDLSKDGSFEGVAAANWKASCPVLEDRKHKVRVFDSGEIVKYLEATYLPAVLSLENPKMDSIPGAKDVFGALIALVKDVGSKNNGVINEDVDSEKLSRFRAAVSALDAFLGEMAVEKGLWLNGTTAVSLSDIELIPKLHHVVIYSEHALNIPMMGKGAEFENVGKFMQSVYAQDWWQQSRYDDGDAFNVWRSKFGLNSSDGRYAADGVEQKAADDQKEDVMVLSIGNEAGSAVANIHLFGATVISWAVDGEQQLFVSGQSLFDQTKAIRGGIPIVFPQFGPGPLLHDESPSKMQ